MKTFKDFLLKENYRAIFNLPEPKNVEISDRTYRQHMFTVRTTLIYLGEIRRDIENTDNIEITDKDIITVKINIQRLYSRLLKLGELGSKTALHLSSVVAKIYKYYQYLQENPKEKIEILKEIEKYENQIMTIFLNWST